MLYHSERPWIWRDVSGFGERMERNDQMAGGDCVSGYILCQTGRAEAPYFIENISMNIYSLEELCYYLDHNLDKGKLFSFTNSSVEWKVYERL